MISDFSIRLRPSNKKASIWFSVCLLLAFLCMLLSGVVRLYNGVIGLVGVCFLVAALQIYTKYVSAVYYCDIISCSDDVPLFVIRQLVGKRNITLCRIALGEIEMLERESRDERRAHKTPDDYKKYSYCPSIDPDVTYRLTYCNQYERGEVILEMTDEMASAIRRYADEVKRP